jgi:hypothetical protein
MQSFVATYAERIQTMTETQVIDALRARQAARNSEGEMLAFLNSVSLVPPEDHDEEINELKSQLSSTARSPVSPFHLSAYVEDALKMRLDTLRKNGR